MARPARVVSVGLSRLFRLIEVPGLLEADRAHFRVEQAVRGIDKEWKWRPLAMCTEWNEAHGALHQMQAECMDQLRLRKESFRADRSDFAGPAGP